MQRYIRQINILHYDPYSSTLFLLTILDKRACAFINSERLLDVELVEHSVIR